MSGLTQVGKAFRDKGSIETYCLQHSSRTGKYLRELASWTLKNTEITEMLAAEECIIFNTNIMKLIGATKVLDVGVFTGYSALAAALTVPDDGRVVAMDITDKDLSEGLKLMEQTGVRHKVDLRIGPAARSLQELLDDGQQETFDFAFIDADKLGYGTYYELCLQLLRSGGAICMDNMLWYGKVLEPLEKMDESTRTIHKLNASISQDDRVQVSLLNLGDGTLFIRKK